MRTLGGRARAASACVLFCVLSACAAEESSAAPDAEVDAAIEDDASAPDDTDAALPDVPPDFTEDELAALAGEGVSSPRSLVSR